MKHFGAILKADVINSSDSLDRYTSEEIRHNFGGIVDMPRQALTRRNGLLQACESCRKAKARCDHETPTCHRCARRKVTCIYEPAPMTKSHNIPVSGDTTDTPSVGLVQQHQIRRNSNQPLSTVLTPPKSGIVVVSNNSPFKRPMTTYGSTHFNATFSENQAKFGFGTVSSCAIDEGKDSTLPAVCDTTAPSNFDAKKVQLGVDILRRFPTFRTHEALLNYLDHYPDPWISRRIVRQCISSIWSQYGHQLLGNRTAEGLATVSVDLCVNSETSPAIVGDDEWVNWFNGPALRWEMIGIIFTIFGLSFYSLQEWDPVFDLPEQHGRNRKTAAIQMRECADDCLNICEEVNFNELVVILMRNSGRLQSVLVGDESQSDLIFHNLIPANEIV